MVEKKEAAVSRKAYGMAMQKLKAEYPLQFGALLDEAYASLGEKSPRVKREEREKAAAAAKQAAAAKREAARLEKIAFLEKELARLTG